MKNINEQSELTLSGLTSNGPNVAFDPIKAIEGGFIRDDRQGSSRGKSTAKYKETVLVGISARKSASSAVQVVMTDDVYKQLGTERITYSIQDKFVFLMPAGEEGLKLFNNKGVPPYRVKISLAGELLHKNIKTTPVLPVACKFGFHTANGVKYLIIEASHIFTGTF